MASRASEEFDDLRGQVFANVAVYKVCEGLGLTLSRRSPLVRCPRCSFAFVALHSELVIPLAA